MQYQTTKWFNVNSHRFTLWNNSFAIPRGEPMVKKVKNTFIIPAGFIKGSTLKEGGSFNLILLLQVFFYVNFLQLKRFNILFSISLIIV